MRSLRGRLGALVASGTLVITLLALLAIAVERWQDENGGLTRRVELVAFQLSESGDPTTVPQPVVGGSDSFVVTLDAGAEVLSSSGTISTELLEQLRDDVWSETTEQDTSVVVEYDVDDVTLVASGVACVDPAKCDTVIVGAFEEAFESYFGSRWYWVLGPALLMAVVAWLASRWVVGRSLRPVEAMRLELESITESDLERRVPIPDTGDELADLGLTLNKTISRLGAAVSANERFVGDAAHELRSPITGVRAALELEASRTPGGLIEDSIVELDRASRLIDDLLVLARRQGRSPRRSDVDLDDLVNREIALTTGRFPNVDIERHIEPVRVVADADSLRRVVANVLENACRYGDQRIKVTLRQEGTECRLVIEDNGPGIPVDDRKRVFERFARLDASRSRASGGSGLGLAIAGETITDHNGTIIVTDSTLGGARIEIALPVK